MSKKKLHIYYFSTALSDEIYDGIVRESKRFKPTFSGVGFDRNVALGLSEQVEITGVSLYTELSEIQQTEEGISLIQDW